MDKLYKVSVMDRKNYSKYMSGSNDYVSSWAVVFAKNKTEVKNKVLKAGLMSGNYIERVNNVGSSIDIIIN